MTLREELYLNQDIQYRDFHSRLVPNIDKNLIIGVRLPVLRKIAKQTAKSNENFEKKYYEEKMVYGLSIGYKMQGINDYIEDLKGFVPMIDNWAICDCCCATYKFTNKYLSEMFEFICSWLDGGAFEIRFAVVMLMDYYLVDEYIDKVINILTAIKSDEYYVKMAVAWALSTAYIKYKEKVLHLFKGKVLDAWTQNKAIQKIRESYRVPKEEKEYLNTMKR